MIFVSRKSLFTIALITLLAIAAAPAQAGSVNKSVHIEAGDSVSDASSVNGSITVGESATVTGEVNTVNGTIRIREYADVGEASTVNGALRIDSGVKAESLSTVNGSIKLAKDVTVGRDVEAVNGKIEIGDRSTVGGDVSNVNGEIEIVASDIGGDISTVSGSVALLAGSTLRGDLNVEKPRGWNWSSRKRRVPEIIIGPGSRVLGTIRLEREVKLFISETADVGNVEGEMTLEDAVRFSGDRP